MKKILFLFYIISPAAIYGMQEESAAKTSAALQTQLTVPQAYVQALGNALHAAHHVAGVTRAKCTMAKVISAGLFTLGAAGYFALSFSKPRPINLLTSFATLCLAQISGHIVGHLTAWLWYRRPLCEATTMANNAALQLHDQEGPFLRGLIDHGHATNQKAGIVIIDALNHIFKHRLRLDHENHDSHFQSAKTNILIRKAALWPKQINSQNPDENELKAYRDCLEEFLPTWIESVFD